MHLEVARAAAICWFGNEHLFAADESHLCEVSLKPVFRGVERLEFVRPMAHQFAAPGAAFVLGTKMWYRRLKADGIESLRLHLPLSLQEPPPAIFGITSDSPKGSDIWVPSRKSTARDLEYAAQRFAAWSLPRPQPSAEVIGQLESAAAALHHANALSGTLLARMAERLAALLSDPGAPIAEYEDCIPAEFSRQWRHLARQALTTVTILGKGDLDFSQYPASAEQADTTWKLSLRLLESISYEVAAELDNAQAA